MTSEELPSTLLHGTVTGLVAKALDHDGLYSPGFNPETLEGFPTFFAFPHYEDYCRRMAQRLIEGKSDLQAQIKAALSNYNLGEIIILDFSAGALPPVHYEHDDMRDNSLFTVRPVTLNMLAPRGRTEVERALGLKATKYFQEHPLIETENSLRIESPTLIERVCLYAPDERAMIRDMFKTFCPE